MKRFFCFLFALLLIVSMSVPVMAADTTPNKTDSFFAYVGNFIKYIFVPRDDYFNKQITQLNDRVNKKLGGVAYLYRTLDNFVKSLNMPNVNAELIFSIPVNFYFKGYKGLRVDALASAQPYIRLLKDVLNVFICILTVIVCYHKLRAFFNEGE